MAAPLNSPLRNITREALAPLWSRMDIPTERIAEALGVTRQGLSWKAKALGLPPRAGNQAPCKRGSDDLFRRMWLAGVSSSDMARYFGYARTGGVTTRRRMMGLPPRTRSRGTGKHSGWVETISLTRFLEGEIAARMSQRKEVA